MIFYFINNFYFEANKILLRCDIMRDYLYKLIGKLLNHINEQDKLRNRHYKQWASDRSIGFQPNESPNLNILNKYYRHTH